MCRNRCLELLATTTLAHYCALVNVDQLHISRLYFVLGSHSVTVLTPNWPLIQVSGVRYDLRTTVILYNQSLI